MQCVFVDISLINRKRRAIQTQLHTGAFPASSRRLSQRCPHAKGLTRECTRAEGSHERSGVHGGRQIFFSSTCCPPDPLSPPHPPPAAHACGQFFVPRPAAHPEPPALCPQLCLSAPGRPSHSHDPHCSTARHSAARRHCASARQPQERGRMTLRQVSRLDVKRCSDTALLLCPPQGDHLTPSPPYSVVFLCRPLLRKSVVWTKTEVTNKMPRPGLFPNSFAVGKKTTAAPHDSCRCRADADLFSPSSLHRMPSCAQRSRASQCDGCPPELPTQ